MDIDERPRGSLHRKRVRGGGNVRSACAKKEGKGLEAIASSESRGWVPRDAR